MNRKAVNNVHLEGVVEDCMMATRREDSRPAARLSVVVCSLADEGTLQTERHKVFVICDGDSVSMLLSLEDSVRRSRAEEGRRAPCCRLDGYLRTIGSDTAVECLGTSIEICPMVSRDRNRNNRMDISGEILSTSFSNNTVRALLDTGVCQVTVFALRKDNQDFWDGVSSGEIVRGKGLSVKGRLISNDYRGPDRTIYESIVSPSAVKLVTLELDRRRAASRGMS